MLITKIMIALVALAGTAIQTYQSTVALGRLGPKVSDAAAVEELRTEFSLVRHPVKWFERQTAVWRLLNPAGQRASDITELRGTYIDLSLHIWSWALLMGGAGGALGLAIVGG